MVVQNLEDLVTSLLDCVASLPGCDAVRTEVQDSIGSLSLSQPSILLTSSHAFLLKNPKLTASSRAFILRCMCTVADNQKVLESLDEQLLLLIINLATQEMTMAKESDPEWADAAQELLVRIACSSKLAHFVLDALLQKFPPGLTTGPHRYIVATLGAVAQHNAQGFVPFLTDILSRTVPLLPHVKTESARCAWSRSLCAFCEAVRECESGKKNEENGEEYDDDIEDVQEASSGTISRSTYSDQAEGVYDIVSGWMSTKDPKVRAEAAECVGELCTIVSRQKVTDDMRKIVQTLLGLYKRATPDQYHLITQGICRLLEATCCEEIATPLDAYVDDLLNALFPHACLDADDVSASPNAPAIKNHSEAFRCFHVAASRYADRIVYYLLHKMQNVQDMQKLGAINVLRHLLNSSGTHMDDKRSLVMMGLRKLLATEHAVTSVRVSRGMVQLCVALADHSFIDTDGGDHVIAFLVRNLVASSDGEGQTRRPDSDVASINQLRTQCAQALHTIASTCVCAGRLLWPYLFEFLCVEKYTPVVADLCKCLRILIQREVADGRQPDYTTGFDNPKVAGRFAVLSRLFVCQTNAPLNGLFARRSRESLALLKGAASWFHPSATDTIVKKAEQLEALIDDLTGASTSSGTIVSPTSPHGEGIPSAPERRAARVARWHDTVLSALDSIISSVAEGEWRQEVAAAMGKQMDLYGNHPEEKAFLLRTLGVVLSKITMHSFVTEHIMLMFRSTNHSSASERVGCAKGMGAIGKVHTDLLLVELENVAKWEHAKKSSGFFGFIKEAMPMRQYTDTEMVNLRATLMLSYGHLVQACPVETVCQRVEQTVMVFLRHYMANQKQETIVREALLETMHLIGTTVHPSKLGTEYTFPARNELLMYIKDYVQSETTETLSSAIRLLACKAASALVRLEPVLTESEIWELGNCLTSAVLPISREKSGLKTLMYELDLGWQYLISSSTYLMTSSTSSTTATTSNRFRRMEDDESSTTMEATVAQLIVLLVSIVTMTPTVNTVTLFLKMLVPYYNRSADHERARSIDATVVVLKTYYEHATDIKLGTASDFNPLSSLLARLSPRLVDSLSSIRLQSLNALHQALRLAHAHKGHGLDTGTGVFDPSAFAREFLTEEGKMDGQCAKRAIKRFAEVIESRLPQSQVQTYLTAIFEMLGDRQSQVSAAAAQLLTHILSDRGATLHTEAETLVTTLLSRLSDVHSSCVQTYSDVLAALVAFAGHQQVIVADVLLKQPLPYSVQLVDAWECICRERPLYPSLVEYLLELMVVALEDPHEVMDMGGGTAVKIVRPELCAYAAALQEIIKAGDIESSFTSSPGSSPSNSPSERLGPVLVVLLQLLVTVADTQFPVVAKEGSKGPLIVTPDLRRSVERPSGLASSAIRTLLTRTRSDDVIDEMNSARAWTECLDKELHINAVATLMRSLCEHRPHWVEPVVRGVQMKERSEREALRATAVAVVAAVVDKCPSSDGSFNGDLFDDCVATLQRSLKDSSLRIRKLSIRGMGGLAERATRYSAVCVDAAMEGLDDVGDRKDEVATESIVSLNKLIGNASDSQLRSILPQVLLKVRPCFDKESSFLRAAAFRLFGEMAARVGAKEESDFAHHLHANIVIIILHMNEEDEEVRKACCRCLQQSAPLFATQLIASVVNSHISSSTLICSNYSSFTKDMASALASAFPDYVNQYALTISNYYKSSQPRIRSAAAQLTGHLLGSLTADIRSTISREIILSGLVLLLKDPEDVGVRVSTARAISALHAYV